MVNCNTVFASRRSSYGQRNDGKILIVINDFDVGASLQKLMNGLSLTHRLKFARSFELHKFERSIIVRRSSRNLKSIDPALV